MKFTERGEIRVSAALTNADEVSFSVSDTGIGIDPENLGLIFEDFAQVDHPIQKYVKGTGLGLPLSKKLATLLGGSVSVESKPGIGSVFTLRVPLRYREPGQEPAIIPKFEWVRDPTSTPVLIIEDSPEMMMMYKSYLKGTGFQVLPASTTREGEEALERIQPGAIILDIVLRSEETWAFAARLKQDHRTKGIPIIVASTIEDQAKGFHLGVDRYLIKPFERFDLITELRAVTGQQPGGRVLIIDDQERDRYVLKQELRNQPLLIMEAANGMEGFNKACNYKPNLIFLDLGMPDLSGFEVLRKLKAEPQLAAIPVVIVTSQILTDSERNELRKYAMAIVSKENLEHTDFADVLQRATNEGLLPASAH